LAEAVECAVDKWPLDEVESFLDGRVEELTRKVMDSPKWPVDALLAPDIAEMLREVHVSRITDSVKSSRKWSRRLRKIFGGPSTTDLFGNTRPGATGDAPTPALLAVQDGEGVQPWHMRLRAARAKANLSRPRAVGKLNMQGIQITADAIKKHEEGAAMPRPEVRTGYASIYATSQDKLFGPGN
jgi:hypothetical protein